MFGFIILYIACSGLDRRLLRTEPGEAPLVLEFVKDVLGIRALAVELDETFVGSAPPVVPRDLGDGLENVGHGRGVVAGARRG
jgi:hypothetical protein